MSEPIALLLGVIVGAILGLIAGLVAGKGKAQSERQLREQSERLFSDRLSSTDGERARLQVETARLAAEVAASVARERAAEQKYEQMNADLSTAFGNLAAKALRDNNASFLEFARQELGKQSSEAKGVLESKEQAIKQLLQPIETSLKELDAKTNAMELARAGAYGGLESLVTEIKSTIPLSLEALRRETNQLITALRAPKVRGNWGELQLRRCVEYAGMVNYCSFNEQVSTRTEEERLLQPDMVIQLPNGRRIVVDAKTPLDAFLDSSANQDEASQANRFLAHAQRVKTHLKDLAAKSYWRQFEPAPEFVVCFLPSEALFSAALEAEPSLIEYSADARVIMATPTTLIALLKSVAYGWQQSAITESAKVIQATGRTLYARLTNVHEHFNKMGNSLAGAVKHYNSLVGSVEGKQGVFYQARKLGELVHSNEELDQFESLAVEDRQLVAEDWVQSELSLAASAEDSATSTETRAGCSSTT